MDRITSMCDMVPNKLLVVTIRFVGLKVVFCSQEWLLLSGRLLTGTFKRHCIQNALLAFSFSKMHT